MKNLNFIHIAIAICVLIMIIDNDSVDKNVASNSNKIKFFIIFLIYNFGFVLQK